MCVGYRITLTHFEIFNCLQRERRYVGNPGSFDAKEIGSAYVFEKERRTRIIMLRQDLHVVHLNSFYVADVKPVGRHVPEPSRLGISLALLFRRLKRTLSSCASAAVLNQDIAKLHVFDGMSGESSEE